MKTNYYESLLLNVLIAQDSTKITEFGARDLRIALFVTDLSDTSETVGVGNTECSDGSYSRKTSAQMAAAFSTLATTGSLVNDADLTLSSFSGVQTIKAVAIVDHTTGKIWMYYNLDPDIVTANGTELKYTTGGWTLTED